MNMLDSEEFSAAAALTATRKSRASFSSALHECRRSSVKVVGDVETAAVPNETTPPNPEKQIVDNTKSDNSMASILGRPETRAYLISYWGVAFVSVCQNEAFPLFAMSKLDGLGMDHWTRGYIFGSLLLRRTVFCLYTDNETIWACRCLTFWILLGECSSHTCTVWTLPLGMDPDPLPLFDHGCTHDHERNLPRCQHHWS